MNFESDNPKSRLSMAQNTHNHRPRAGLLLLLIVVFILGRQAEAQRTDYEKFYLPTDQVENDALANEYERNSWNYEEQLKIIEHEHERQQRRQQEETRKEEELRRGREEEEELKRIRRKRAKFEQHQGKEENATINPDCEIGKVRLVGHITHFCNNMSLMMEMTNHSSMVEVIEQLSYVRNITKNVFKDVSRSFTDHSDSSELTMLCHNASTSRKLNLTNIYLDVFNLDRLRKDQQIIKNITLFEDKKTSFLYKLWKTASEFINPMAKKETEFLLDGMSENLRDQIHKVYRRLLDLFDLVAEHNYRKINEDLCQVLRCVAAVPYRESGKYLKKPQFCTILKDLDLILNIISQVMVDNDDLPRMHKRMKKLLVSRLLPKISLEATARGARELLEDELEDSEEEDNTSWNIDSFSGP